MNNSDKQLVKEVIKLLEELNENLKAFLELPNNTDSYKQAGKISYGSEGEKEEN